MPRGDRERPAGPVAPQSRPISRGRRILTYLLVFVTCVVVVDALVGEKGFVETMRAKRQHAELAAAIAHLKQENARLREEARRLREDPRTIEEIARRELGLIKPGEKLFIIKDVSSPSRP